MAIEWKSPTPGSIVGCTGTAEYRVDDDGRVTWRGSLTKTASVDASAYIALIVENAPAADQAPIYIDWTGSAAGSDRNILVQPAVMYVGYQNLAGSVIDLTRVNYLGTPPPAAASPFTTIRRRVRMDAAAPASVPAVDSMNIQRSADAGVTWSNIRGGQPFSPVNLLSAQDSGFEDSTLGVGGWTNYLNATLARSTTYFSTGVAGLAVTAVAAGDMAVQSPSVPVTAGFLYEATIRFRTAVTARTMTLYLRFYTTGGAQVGEAPLLTTADATSWKSLSTSLVAPATATQARIVAYCQTAAISEIHAIDRALIGLGTTYDYEAPPSVPVIYRMQSNNVEGTTILTSAWSASTAPVTSTLTTWQLVDPLDPLRSISVFLVGDEVKWTEPQTQGLFEALGRRTKILVNDTVQGEEGSLQLFLATQADYDAFQLLRRSQRTLLLQSPVDGQRYVQFLGDRVTSRSGVGSSQKRTVSINVVEVTAP